MKDPISTCTYNQLYQNVKRYSKNGEHFCKELMTVFQQRAELEMTYAKGLQKLAGKLIRASKGMSNKSLGNAFHQEAILEIRQVLEEHNKRKRPLDNAIERNGKLVTANWSEQLKIKKKLVGLTREHEALFNFVENNRQICTEKEKQKMLNRLTKSAEMQTRVDEEYFNINMEGHQMRLKWENTLKTYSLTSIPEHVTESLPGYDYNLVDVDKDIRALVEENSTTAEDNKAEFLMTDYFEEDSKSLMGKDRRRDAIKLKLERLEDRIAKTKKDCEGIEKLIKTYSENPSFSNQKNLEETEQQLDESTLKLDLLEATHCKLSVTLSELEGKPKSFHRFSSSILKWKDKDCEHSVVQLTRPVKLRRTPFRSRQSLRASIIYKGPVQFVAQQSVEPSPNVTDQETSTTAAQETGAVECDSTVNGLPSIGKCKALYNFTPEHDDELTLKEGDLLDICAKEENGWWFGTLNGQTGHFPSTYVEELPVLDSVKSSDA
uniref:Osteoclast-stimulating factor 1 n=1 Tax=Amphiprion ocellaris TaxID=80972 RepID=A0AAQ5Z4Q0_AMPOC